MRKLIAALLLLISLATTTVSAVEPGEQLSDPTLEVRARRISAGLRCPVCQNQSIDDSSSGVARDFRLLVRERVLAGDSDRDVRQFIADRYGPFVLLEPPVEPMTYPLWAAPLVILAVGTAVVALRCRTSRSRSQSDRPPHP